MKKVNLKLFLYNLSIAKFVLYIKKYKEKVKVKHISLSHFSIKNLTSKLADLTGRKNMKAQNLNK